MLRFNSQGEIERITKSKSRSIVFSLRNRFESHLVAASSFFQKRIFLKSILATIGLLQCFFAFAPFFRTEAHNPEVASSSPAPLLYRNQVVLPQVLNNLMSIQMAATYSGYSLQYLRRLLRSSRLEGVKLGQMWLVDKGALDIYIEKAQDATDQRFGPK